MKNKLFLLISGLIYLIVILNFKPEGSHSVDNNQLYNVLSLLSVIFLIGIVFLYRIDNFPDKVKQYAVSFFILIRLPLLILKPEISTDLNRNLMFGHLLLNGHNPYLLTGDDIRLILGDLDLIVPYTSEWSWRSYDYPSFAILFFTLIVFISIILHISPFIFAKLLLNIFDLITSYVIYKIIKDRLMWREDTAIKYSLAFLFNPYSLILTGLEGQFESITNLFAFMAIYYALSIGYGGSDDEYAYFVGFLIGVGFLFKYYPVLIFPVLLYQIRDLRLIIRSVHSLILTVFVFSLPFILNSPYIAPFLEFQSTRGPEYSPAWVIDSVGDKILFNSILFLILGIILLQNELLGYYQLRGIFISAFIMIEFIINSNSLFPWYLIMVFPGTIFVRHGKSEFSNIYAWILITLIYQLIWVPGSSNVIITIFIGVISLYYSFFKENSSIKRTRDLRVLPSNNRLVKFINQHPQFEFISMFLSMAFTLAAYSGLNHDMQVWISVSVEVFNGINPYVTGLTRGEYYAYPPPWMMILYWSYYMYSLLDIDSIYALRLMIKLPIIIFHVFTTILVIKYLRFKQIEYENIYRVYFILLLNPFIFIISVLWGMFDIIPAFFIVLSIYILEVKKEYTSSYIVAGISASMAFLLKLYPVVVIPALFMTIKTTKNKILYTFSSLITIVIVVFPFYRINSFAFIETFIFHSSRLGGGITYFNGIWFLIKPNIITIEVGSGVLNGISYSLMFTILSYVYYKSRKLTPLDATLLSLLAFFISFKLINEQYIVVLLPVIIVHEIINKNSIQYSSRITAIAGTYTIVSLPITELFYFNFIQELGDSYFALNFYLKQIILFILGVMFVYNCLLYLISIINHSNGTGVSK